MTRVIAITRQDVPLRLNPRRDAYLQAGDTVYLVGPYRELLHTLRKGQRAQHAVGGDRATKRSEGGEDPAVQATGESRNR